MLSRIYGDLLVEGSLVASQLAVPMGAISDIQVAPAAGIQATKLEHQHRLMYAQQNSAATAETRVVYVCYGASGSVVDFRAGCISVCTGNATITLDLLRNGSSILASPLVLNSSDTNRVAKQGVVSSSTLAAGNVLELVVTVSAGTGTLGTGLFAALTVHESAT